MDNGCFQNRKIAQEAFLSSIVVSFSILFIFSQNLEERAVRGVGLVSLARPGF